MQVRLLSEIPLNSATKYDIARAINYSMKKSKTTAWNMTRALDLHGGVSAKHINKIYDEYAFSKDNTIEKNFSDKLSKHIKKILKLDKKPSDVNLMDYAAAFIVENTKKAGL